MKRGKILLWIVVAVAVAAGLGVVRTRRLHEKESAPLLQPAPAAVEVAAVTRGPVVRNRHVLGRVIGSEEINVSPRIMGRVLALTVREGDRVRGGELLAELDAREMDAAVVQAESGLTAARSAWETQQATTARDSVLFVATAIAREQWDHSRTARTAAYSRWQSARETLALARTRQSYARLLAPGDGIVAARLADPGDLAVPGKPLIKLVQQQSVRVRAAVPARDFVELKPGQVARLTLDAETVQAVVSRVFPALDDHLAAVEIDLDDPPPGFVSGTSVGVDLTLQSAEGLRVPVDALLEGMRGVFVFAISSGGVRPVPVQVSDLKLNNCPCGVASGVVRPVSVQVVHRSFEQALVTGDLTEGESVIVARPSRLMRLAAGVPVVIAAGGATP